MSSSWVTVSNRSFSLFVVENVNWEEWLGGIRIWVFHDREMSSVWSWLLWEGESQWKPLGEFLPFLPLHHSPFLPCAVCLMRWVLQGIVILGSCHWRAVLPSHKSIILNVSPSELDLNIWGFPILGQNEILILFLYIFTWLPSGPFITLAFKPASSFLFFPLLFRCSTHDGKIEEGKTFKVTLTGHVTEG